MFEVPKKDAKVQHPNIAITDKDCDSVVSQCQTAYQLTTSFIQAVHFFSYTILPVMEATFGISHQAHIKVNPTMIKTFLKFIGETDELSLSRGLMENDPKAKPLFCKRILSSGRISINELFPMIFLSDSFWNIYNKKSTLSMSD